MAKIDMDAYDSNDVQYDASGESGKGNKRFKTDRMVRRIVRGLVLVLSVGCIVGAYPTAIKLFDSTMDKEGRVDVIPDKILDLVPSNLLSKIFDKIAGAAGIDDSEEEEPGAEEQQDELEALEDPNILAETTPVSEAYISGSLFLGDERLLGFAEENLISANLIYAENGMGPKEFLEHEFTDPVTNLTGTAASLMPAREPERIYMMLGLSGITDENFIDDYKALIGEIKNACPGVPIVVCSQLPINEEMAVNSSIVEETVNNGMINATNKQLLSMTRDVKGYFLNAYSKFMGDNDQLKESYDGGNGVILSDDGYEAWLAFIQKHAVPSN